MRINRFQFTFARRFVPIALLVMLLVAGCTDPVANDLYQDQNQPGSPVRAQVFPPYDLERHPEYLGTLLVYREWEGGQGGQPTPLDKPYITMYQSRELYDPKNPGYFGFKVWRKAAGGNWVELTDGKYMVPETIRSNPILPENWKSSNKLIIYDEPNVVFNTNNVELDFPAYNPDLDGFRGDQNPILGWDVHNPSGYYPYKYFFSENYSYGFVDTGFDVGTMDYEDYKWAVCFVDYSGNMSDPVIVEVE
ncbi:MAG TPA: hypothetical protein VM054_11725 [bacterium]|nr:hypothetical protein [bacterium]